MTTNDTQNGKSNERESIIRKYDFGRKEGAEILPWEDPGFELYHKIDFYGFIHDTRLPNDLDASELKRRKLELSREEKWLGMSQNWEKFKNSSKLRSRTYKGVPNKLRTLLWSLFLDVPSLKQQQIGKYEEMCSLARQYSPDIRQIDLDINRTFRDHVMFRERYGIKQKSLFNVLSAYSVYNSEIGYCQGMSQIAAFLLMHMNEEDSFWALSQLFTNPDHAMHGFFVSGFPKLLRFQAHHEKIINKMLPKLKKHFEKHGVESCLYTLKWFFLCFLDRLPFPLVLRLWDIFLLEGDKTLTCGAYMILKMHKKQLLSCGSFDEIMNYLQCELPKDFKFDCDTAIIHYQKCIEELVNRKCLDAGEASDDEFPQVPFGMVSNIEKLLNASHPPIEEETVKVYHDSTQIEPERFDQESDDESIIATDSPETLNMEDVITTATLAEEEDCTIMTEDSVSTSSEKYYDSRSGSPPANSFELGNTLQRNNNNISSSSPFQIETSKDCSNDQNLIWSSDSEEIIEKHTSFRKSIVTISMSSVTKSNLENSGNCHLLPVNIDVDMNARNRALNDCLQTRSDIVDNSDISKESHVSVIQVVPSNEEN